MLSYLLCPNVVIANLPTLPKLSNYLYYSGTYFVQLSISCFVQIPTLSSYQDYSVIFIVKFLGFSNYPHFPNSLPPRNYDLCLYVSVSSGPNFLSICDSNCLNYWKKTPYLLIVRQKTSFLKIIFCFYYGFFLKNPC